MHAFRSACANSARLSKSSLFKFGFISQDELAVSSTESSGSFQVFRLAEAISTHSGLALPGCHLSALRQAFGTSCNVLSDIDQSSSEDSKGPQEDRDQKEGEGHATSGTSVENKDGAVEAKEGEQFEALIREGRESAQKAYLFRLEENRQYQRLKESRGPQLREDLHWLPTKPPDQTDEAAMKEWLSYFRMKVVDINRTSRGSPTGGIGRFSALVVVGNSNGVIGLGGGKSEAISEAIKKANNQAMKTLFFVPRYNRATILHSVKAKYGKAQIIMYPRSSGSGCKASHLVSGICELAGIQDIGVKIHGTRNKRNMVKALIRGFESQVVTQEVNELPNFSVPESQTRKMKGLPQVVPAGGMLA